MTAPAETYALEQLLVRMRTRFPDVPVDQLRSMISDLHHQYDGRPIRDFIPVLVERELREQLKLARAMPRQSRDTTTGSRPLENA